MEKALTPPAGVVGQFAFEGTLLSAAPYGAGHINDTYLVETGPKAAPHRYILQRLNTHVFRQPRQLMENIAAVTGYLREAMKNSTPGHAMDTLTLIPTHKGECCLQTDEGEYWRAYGFIQRGVSFQTVDDPRLLAASAQAFGHFARALNGFPAETLHETIPHFHDTPRRLQNLKAAIKADSCARAQGCAAEIEFALQREKDCTVLMDLLNAGKLPLRVTHNDTKLNNVLIDPHTLQPVCVIDLDTVMPGLIHNDFGDAIRTGATTAAEDETDLSRVRFELSLYKTYRDSYLQALGGALTENEVKTLPWGARLMTLECGIRFLTDHLEGDVYFKVHRPGHNLQRARTQFKLVADMERCWESM